jgi:hypothetical protein
MSSGVPETDLRNLWQKLETEETTVSAEQLHLKALGVLRKNRRDLIARLVFALLASAFCGLAVMNARLTSVRGFAAAVMAMLLASAGRNLYRSYGGNRRKSPPDAGAPWASCLEFYRSELEKQRTFAAFPVWQLLAALLTVAWLTPGALRRDSADPLGMILPAVLLAATGLIVLMAVRKFQARHIEADLEALSYFEDETRPGGSHEIPFNKSKG